MRLKGALTMITKKTVAIIPPKIQYDKNLKVEEKKLRVAAYCRVSTLLEEQEGSYETQVRYYEDKISKCPHWICAGIFADDGKSATGTAKRDDFNSLIKACMNDKIDLVLTKSVSRFARNTVDALQNIRKLKDKNIPIIFEKEGINTMESGGELLITILSSQAQEESRNISENTRWGITRKFESGKVKVNFSRFMGYTKDKNGNLIIVPEEAKIVQRIFREYLDGSSLGQIARSLEKDCILTKTGKNHWNVSTIQRMLSQEKYMGDALLQKTYTTDFLTKHKVKNDGFLRQYYIENDHEPIISKEIFMAVQTEKKRRATLNKSAVAKKANNDNTEVKSKYSSKYVLSDIMLCADCGHKYRRQVWSKYGEKSAVWRCEDRLKLGKKSSCIHSPTLKEYDLHKAIMKAINEVIENKENFISTFRTNMLEVIDNYNAEITNSEIDKQIETLEKEMLSFTKRNTKFEPVTKDYEKDYKLLHDEIESLKRQKETNLENIENTKLYEDRLIKVNEILNIINPKLLNFDQELVKRLIESIKVKRNNVIEIRFYCGIVLDKVVE